MPCVLTAWPVMSVALLPGTPPISIPSSVPVPRPRGSTAKMLTLARVAAPMASRTESAMIEASTADHGSDRS